MKNEDTRMMLMVLFKFFIVNCEHILNFVLVIDFEQANVSCVNIEKIKTSEDKTRYIMSSVVVL